MASFDALRDDQPWSDPNSPITFLGSGQTATALMAGIKISGDADQLASAYRTATSRKDFVDKCRRAGLTVHANETSRLEDDSSS